MFGTGHELLDDQNLDLALNSPRKRDWRIPTGPKGMAVGCKTVGSSSLITLASTAPGAASATTHGSGHNWVF
jgi:hypothetical protein